MRKLSSILAGVIAVAACNQLLGNDNATLQTIDASESSSSSSSGSGSGGIAEGGPSEDAAVPSDAGTTCPCGQTDAYCKACPLIELTGDSWNEPALEIAVTDAHLFVRMAAKVIRYRLPSADTAALSDPQTFVPQSMEHLVAGVPVLSTNLFASYRPLLQGNAPTLHRVDANLHSDAPSAVYLMADTDLVAAPEGLLAIANDTKTVVRYVSATNDQTVVVVPDGGTTRFFTANAGFAFVGREQGNQTAVHRVPLPPPSRPEDATKTFALDGYVDVAAASDETLFFTSQSSTAIRTVSAGGEDGTAEITLVSIGAPITKLAVDGPLLLAGTAEGDTLAFDATGATKLMEPLSQPLVATSRNTSHFFALIGTTLYWARRAPLRPPP